MKTLDLLKVLFIFSLLFTSCTDDDKEDDPTTLPSSNTIAGIATENENFSILETALTSAGLVSTFSDDNSEYTVFAPTDAAFQSLLAASNGISSLDDISSKSLDLILKHHVVSGKAMASDLTDGQMLTTLAGTKLEVKISNGEVTVGGVKVTSVDVEASNGVIHIVEGVIVPTEALTIAQLAISTSDFSTLVTALSKANLVTPFTEADNSYTVFAPTNKAFEDAGIDLDALSTEELQRILLHHVVSSKVMSSDLTNGQKVTTLAETELEVMLADGSVKIGEANVILADVGAINGVVHGIDKVLIPMEEKMTIAGIAASNEDFSTLVSALTLANLVDAFNDENAEYTVFAPNNAAFEALLAAENGIASFDDLSMEALDVLLKHHVVEGKVLSSDLSDGQMVKTLGGTMLEVSIMGSDVMIGGAKVAAADVEASNGVIHIVEDVIVPTEALTIAQTAISNPAFSTLVAALVKADLVAPFTDAMAEYTVFAPTNDAFTAAGINLDEVAVEDLQRILMHHVVASKVLSSALSNGQMVETLAKTNLDVMLMDGMVKIDDATVVIADVQTVNGVIHAVDKVLMPNTIVDVATSAGSFTSLLGALTTTELISLFNIDYVDGELTEYTVFAPNDDAFAALGDVELTTEQLAEILKNHVVAGKVLASDLSDGQMVETLGDAQLTVSISNGVVTVGGAQVIATDVMASNGAIHVLSSVITD